MKNYKATDPKLKELRDLKGDLVKIIDMNAEEYKQFIKDVGEIKQLANQIKMQVEQYNRFKAGEISWDKMSLEMVKIIAKDPSQNIVMFIEWLEDNKNNTLPEQSTGSFYKALTDIDNFFSLLELHNYSNDFFDDHYNKIKTIFNEIIFKRIIKQ